MLSCFLSFFFPFFPFFFLFLFPFFSLFFPFFFSLFPPFSFFFFFRCLITRDKWCSTGGLLHSSLFSLFNSAYSILQTENAVRVSNGVPFPAKPCPAPLLISIPSLIYSTTTIIAVNLTFLLFESGPIYTATQTSRWHHTTQCTSHSTTAQHNAKQHHGSSSSYSSTTSSSNSTSTSSSYEIGRAHV